MKPLFTNFAPVSAKQWKQKIQFELKGADYNETLIWNSPEDIKVKPFYDKEDVKDVLKAISLLSSAEGRFQIFKTNNEIVFVLDYAHTDDALKNVISTINSIRNNVF